MKTRIALTLAALLLTGCGSLDSCSADPVNTANTGTSTSANNGQLNGRPVIVVTATPALAPVPAQAQAQATPVPAPEPCIWQPDGSGLTAYSKQPCTPLLVDLKGGLAIPTPAIARDLGDGVNYRVYGGWEDCRYDAAGTTGGCPWTTAGGYPADDPRHASQVGR